MGSPFIDMQLLAYNSDDAKTGTMSDVVPLDVELTEGVWEFSGDVDYKFRTSLAASAGIGSNPRVGFANEWRYVSVANGRIIYLTMERLGATSGNYYANKITDGEV